MSSIQDNWKAVDDYIVEMLVGSDDALQAALDANAAAGLPAIDVSPAQGKFLNLLATIRGARRILEIGTLGGYSTIWLARALPADGRLITLEVEPKHAEVARRNIERAGVGDVVEIRVGAALDTLQEMHAHAIEPFDFIFIDADKPNNPAYLRWALSLSNPGTVIVGDNAIRRGEVIDVDSDDPRVVGSRALIALLAAEPHVEATVMQTVGHKGYDGFAMAVVTG